MLVGLHVPTNFQIYRQTLTLSKCMCMRASELRKFWHFYILKLLFLSIFCRYSRYFVGTNDMLVGLHVPTNFLIHRQTVGLTLSKCMCMRASELRKFWHFYILKLIFLSIFCRYIRYFVGTNDMLVGSHVPTNFQMYRQKSEKALLGGGGAAAAPAPPPPLATLMSTSSWSMTWSCRLILIGTPCFVWLFFFSVQFITFLLMEDTPCSLMQAY